MNQENCGQQQQRLLPVLYTQKAIKKRLWFRKMMMVVVVSWQRRQNTFLMEQAVVLDWKV